MRRRVTPPPAAPVRPERLRCAIYTRKSTDEGLDQDKELEGDSLGDVFAARVGYDPTAYVTLLTRLRTLKGDDRAFFKTHPNFSARIQAVQQVIQTQGWKPTGVLLEDRFARARGKI